jgi:putative transposase
MRFVFIAAEKALYPVRLLCELLEVSRSGFYAWVDRPTPPKTTADARLVVEIRAALVRGRGAYGSPRVHRELRAHGIRVSRKRVERLMRENGIVVSSAA